SGGSARLMHLEAAVLGFERVGDMNAWYIPEAYHHYTTEGREDLMSRVMEHNALDIVSLAALTGVAGALLDTGELEGVCADPLALAKIFQKRKQLVTACQ